MSVSISAVSSPQAGAALFDTVTANAQRARDEISTLSAQISSGTISTDYAGLGAGARPALDLSAALSANTALSGALANTGALQQTAQTALGQLEKIATSFAASATTLVTAPGGIAALAAQARDALGEVAQLLNTQYGNLYVFGGQDSLTQPVPNPAGIATSAFATAIGGAVAGLAANGPAAVTAQTLAFAAPGGTSPFSPALEANGAQAVADLGGGVTIRLAPLATQNSDAVSSGTGTTSTGSYTRDILCGLASLAALTPGQGSDPGFPALVQSISTGLRGAATAATTDSAALGSRQDQVSAQQTELSDTATSLRGQLGSLQDVDLAQASASLSAAQTRLQASYQVLASLKGLSLAQYL